MPLDPSKVASGIGVVELKIENDPELETGLAKLPGSMTTLEYIADHGGEVGWDWNAVKPHTRDTVADMILLGVVKEIEYVTHAAQVSGRLALRLTDKGRNVVEIHRRRRVTATSARILSLEEAAALKS